MSSHQISGRSEIVNLNDPFVKDPSEGVLEGRTIQCFCYKVNSQTVHNAHLIITTALTMMGLLSISIAYKALPLDSSTFAIGIIITVAASFFSLITVAACY